MRITKEQIIAGGHNYRNHLSCFGTHRFRWGVLPAVLSAFLWILLLTLPVQNGLIFNGWSFLIMFLNGMVFSTIALVLSFMSKSYADTPRYNAYIITPMSFLCNTFFSTDQMPGVFRRIVGALPLSQASGMIRAISHGEDPGTMGFIVLLLYLVVFSLIAMVYIYRKKTL